MTWRYDIVIAYYYVGSATILLSYDILRGTRTLGDEKYYYYCRCFYIAYKPTRTQSIRSVRITYTIFLVQ